MRRSLLPVMAVTVAAVITACHPPRKFTTPAMDVKTRPGSYTPDGRLEQIMSDHLPGFSEIIARARDYRLQVIYTQVDRRADNTPLFTHHYFNVDPHQYFYPASTVKLPVAVLALQKLKELDVPGLDRNTTMVTGAAYKGQTAVYNDPQTEHGRPTIANYVRKIFAVSDNDAFNRLYEFLGQEYVNNTLRRMGYDSVEILHRLQVSLTTDQNRHTNPVVFYDTAGRAIYRQSLVKSNMPYRLRNTLLGNGYMAGGVQIDEPFDFSMKNRITLPDLHSMMISLLFPDAVPQAQRFNLDPGDRAFLLKCLSMKPRESVFPDYSTYPDGYSKLLMCGGDGSLPDSAIRIFNKEGDAYGFLTDVAYIADFKNNIEFFLSATIYCNSDGIFNDDRYDYKTIGLPFLKALGLAVYDHERKRKRKHAPDLASFNVHDQP
ncbi:MAG TPA: serine hydrolase [Flavisolibacter sp.]